MTIPPPVPLLGGFGLLGLGVLVLQVPAIPSGPAWAVAIVIVLGGLVAIGNTVVKIVRAAKSHEGNPEVVARQLGVTEIKDHMDDIAKEAREHRDRVMGNIDQTRHAMTQPLTTMVTTLQLVEMTLQEIKNRLERRG